MRNRWTVCLTLITLLAGLLPAAGPTLAAGPILPAGLAQGDDFLVSHAEGTIRGNPAAAYNDDQGEYLVVWADGRENGAYWDIYGQFVTAGGLPRGDNFVIRDEASSILTYPDVAYDTTNQRYLVVWYDLSEVDVEGQILNSDGSAFGSALNIAEGDPGDMRGYPAVAFHPQLGEYLVVYHGGAAGNLNIYGKRVGAAGSVGATEYGVSTAAGDQTDPDVSVDPSTNGDFLIVWEDGRVATDQIYGCLMHSTWFLGPEFAISTSATIPRYNPAVAFNPAAGTAGEWLVVFQRDAGGDSQIGGRRVTAAGAPTGDGIHVCDDSGDQLYPDVAYNAYHNDQWLVVWEDHRAGATDYDIYGRRVAVDGSTQDDTFSIFVAPDYQSYPAVASSSTYNGYLVLFSDSQTHDIVGQRVATVASGLTISTPVDDQEQPAVAYNSQNTEFLVVWHDRRAGNWDIWGQRLDLDGTPLGSSFAICSETGAQLNPAVAYNLDANQYLVVWEDRRNDAGDIYGQIIEGDGDLSGGNLVIADLGTTGRHVPELVYNPISGEFFVVYMYEAENNNIRGRRLGVNGAPLAAEIDIATGTTDQNYPDVACRTMEPGGGGYLVVWRDTDGTQRDVKGQRLNQTGGLLEGVLDLCTEASSQWSPAVAYSPDDDRYLVVWPDDRDSASQGRNVYGRQVGGGGALYTGFAISTASGNQAAVAVTYGRGPASYIVAWEDTRAASTTPDLYGQRVSGTGELLETQVGNNDLLYTGPGRQESPAVAWAGDGTQGLLVWEDDRNGESDDIYGLRLEAVPVTAGNRIFLPLVVRND